MNWYKCAKTLEASNRLTNNSLLKTASMSLYVHGFEHPQDLKTVRGICEYLSYLHNSSNLLTPEESKIWNANSPIHTTFFSPDGDDALKSIGTINNYVKGYPKNKIAKLRQFVMSSLKKINVSLKEIQFAKFENSSDFRVIRYVMSNNPNVREKIDSPPEINYSGSHVDSIVMALKGKTADPNGENLDAIATLHAIDALKTPVDVANKITTHKQLVNTPQNLAGAAAVFQRLQEVRKVAQWAVDHGYKSIYFV